MKDYNVPEIFLVKSYPVCIATYLNCGHNRVSKDSSAFPVIRKNLNFPLNLGRSGLFKEGPKNLLQRSW